jgi:protein-S-isoprenylcysteine O-methyltransferase Ste14
MPIRRVRKFLRRFRRYLFLPLVAIALLWLPPPARNLLFDEITDGVGVLIALLGQLLRLWAWGSNAQTGKLGVRTHGPYALMQHPLYVGNLFIVFGLLVIFNNPWAYLICGLPFVFLYCAIVELEEEQMRREFGEEYYRYAARGVPRFFPALRNLPEAKRTSRPFSWRLALRKEYESLLGWMAGAIILEMYEEVLWQGVEKVRSEVIILTGLLCAVGILSLSLYIRKVRRWKG